jgi:hypothetical protein
VPSVARPYAIDGTDGLAVIRCWYVAMADVTVVSVFVPVYFRYLLQTQHRNPLTT